ncbi:MAG: chorismate mutase [Clostridia bacterium]|nr:chorismate mutase [Clostridia bacterium]
MADINEYRNRIDAIDDEMLKLFLERMEIANNIGQYKRDNNLPILNRQREREVLAGVAEKSGDMELYAHRFFSNIMEISRSYQAATDTKTSPLIEQIKAARLPADAIFPHSGTIAVQGVEGAYAQAAADRLFNRGKLMFFKSFSGVFEAVESGLCEFGIVPVENSSFGSVRDVYELFREHDVYITRATKINVQHELLAKPGTKLSDIREIYSHEQAIGQCDNFLKSLDDVKIIPVANTALAAQMVAESDRTDVASISSHDSGELYGLKTVRNGIMDSANNYTRFVVLRKDMAIYPGANRISLYLTTPHRPGALYEILSQFAALDLNIIKLESVPIAGSDFEFLFYLDFTASVWDDGVLPLLDYLETECDIFKFLVNYPEIR